MKFSHIINSNGEWYFSKYFDYLDQISEHLPDSLRQFALSPSSYALTGPDTLHDARLVAFFAKRTGPEDSNVRLIAEFVHQSYEAQMPLTYNSVSAFHLDHECLSRSPAIDVISHEFSLTENRTFCHKVICDGEIGFWVTFEEFSWSICEIDVTE